jgi:hypothetical protein
MYVIDASYRERVVFMHNKEIHIFILEKVESCHNPWQNATCISMIYQQCWILVLSQSTKCLGICIKKIPWATHATTLYKGNNGSQNFQKQVTYQQNVCHRRVIPWACRVCALKKPKLNCKFWKRVNHDNNKKTYMHQYIVSIRLSPRVISIRRHALRFAERKSTRAHMLCLPMHFNFKNSHTWSVVDCWKQHASIPNILSPWSHEKSKGRKKNHRPNKPHRPQGSTISSLPPSIPTVHQPTAHLSSHPATSSR